MMHFICRGKGHVAVVSACDEEAAVRRVTELFEVAGCPLVEMEVMMFDPEVEGGVLIRPEDML